MTKKRTDKNGLAAGQKSEVLRMVLRTCTPAGADIIRPNGGRFRRADGIRPYGRRNRRADGIQRSGRQVPMIKKLPRNMHSAAGCFYS